MAGIATLRAAEEVKKQIALAAARKMGCAPEQLIFRDEAVYRKDTGVDAGLRPAGRGEAPSPHGQVSVSGRVEGQILRGSLQQKPKEEGPNAAMTFEEAVVAATDFHGAFTATVSYASAPEARGGK